MTDKEKLELKKIINSFIAKDVSKLLEHKEFQRFYFWMLAESGAFSMPDIRVEGARLSFQEGQRALGMGLVFLASGFAHIEACRGPYNQLVLQAQGIFNSRKENSDE